MKWWSNDFAIKIKNDLVRYASIWSRIIIIASMVRLRKSSRRQLQSQNSLVINWKPSTKWRRRKTSMMNQKQKTFSWINPNHSKPSWGLVKKTCWVISMSSFSHAAPTLSSRLRWVWHSHLSLKALPRGSISSSWARFNVKTGLTADKSSCHRL